MDLANRDDVIASLRTGIVRMRDRAKQLVLDHLGPELAGAASALALWGLLRRLFASELRDILHPLYSQSWEVTTPEDDDRTVERLTEERAGTVADQMRESWSRNLRLEAERRRAIVEGDAPPGTVPVPLSRLGGEDFASGQAGHEYTAATAKAVITATRGGRRIFADDGRIYRAPQLVWGLEVVKAVETHCCFCPLMKLVGEPIWSKYVPEGPPAHYGCACGILVYPPSHYARPQLVKDDVVWSAAAASRVFDVPEDVVAACPEWMQPHNYQGSKS